MGVESALVIGAGIAGTAVAGLLARGGVHVDLVEVRTDANDSPGQRAAAGVVLRPNALRILGDLGVLDTVLRDGFAYDSVGLRDADGTLLQEIRTPSIDADLPPFVGFHRSTLARLLLAAAVDAGVEVHAGTSPVRLTQDDHGVEVLLEDETDRRYDLVVGAEGVRSWTRHVLGIKARTTRNEIGAWRALLPRPESVVRSEIYVAGPRLLLGCAPAGPDTINAFVLERLSPGERLLRRDSARLMHDMTADYGGLWADVRDRIDDGTPIWFAPFETHALPPPWNRGRVVLVGDAVHAAPPTVGQGIALALEDAAVLGELVLGSGNLDDDLWHAYHERRVPRVEETMETSTTWTERLFDGQLGDLGDLFGQMARRLDDEPA